MPFVLLRLCFLGFRSPEYLLRWRERFGWLPPLEISGPVFWLHAVSVGEVEAARPLINRLLTLLPGYQIIITTVTPTGGQTVQQRFADKVIHLYLPYDLPCSIRRFLKHLRPSICVIMETELWPNLYHYCHRQHIPIVLANARMSLKSLNGYRKFGTTIKRTLACVSRLMAQSKLDADRFMSLGCEPARISITGNLKFDMNVPANLHEQSQFVRNKNFPHRPVWIAASTHEHEEAQVLDAFEQILREYDDCLLILAPRHPQRFKSVENLCGRRGFEVVRKSDNKACSGSTRILLLDTLGDLQLYYACADIAFVGGSLVAAGGHNMLEPASLGVPIISGRNIANFHEIAELLQGVDAMYLVDDAAALAEKVMALLADAGRRRQMGENAKRLVVENRGSTDQVVSIIRSMLD